ncbi:prepilin peptidase [Bradyrhizobium japonicum]|uniref:prepilin peptidase n=1 Tax=Bradyrhizobium japonicum TaxID=375 RepID=UPI001CB70DF8|nr:prepilin peptidase [Bradyrhizobium japonicum]
MVAAHAVDGTWTGATTEWTDGTNWTSNPDVPDGTATFTNTGSNTVDSNGVINIGAVVFTAAPSAQAYTVNTNDIFVVNGAGISNNSTNVQTFNVSSSMVFTNSSSASGGSNVVTYNVSAGAMIFNDTSTAGSANITNNGDVEFNGSSNAGTATITNNIVMNFNDASSANNANITNAATGFLSSNTSATAGTATISNSGSLIFAGSATAGSATITTDQAAPEETGPALALSIALPLGVFASLITVPGAEGLYGAYLAALILAIAANDARYYLIPNELTAAAFALALLRAGAFAPDIGVAALLGRWPARPPWRCRSRSLMAFYRRWRGRVGLGDVKLAAVCGV